MLCPSFSRERAAERSSSGPRLAAAPRAVRTRAPRRGAGLGVGWVSLLYDSPAYRHRGCGAQLLGRAVMHYRELGRTALRLHAAESNRAALAFYERHGFVCLSSEKTELGRLLLLEKKLGGPGHV